MTTPKTILITGTSNGFGNDVAKTLAATGHHVFATMRDMGGRHRDTANELQSKGIETLELDVTNNTSVDAACRRLFGKTDRFVSQFVEALKNINGWLDKAQQHSAVEKFDHFKCFARPNSNRRSFVCATDLAFPIV